MPTRYVVELIISLWILAGILNSGFIIAKYARDTVTWPSISCLTTADRWFALYAPLIGCGILLSLPLCPFFLLAWRLSTLPPPTWHIPSLHTLRGRWCVHHLIAYIHYLHRFDRYTGAQRFTQTSVQRLLYCSEKEAHDCLSYCYLHMLGIELAIDDRTGELTYHFPYDSVAQATLLSDSAA